MNKRYGRNNAQWMELEKGRRRPRLDVEMYWVFTFAGPSSSSSSSCSQWDVSGELTSQSMSMPSSSGMSGVSLRTVVKRLTADTVASSKKTVSKMEHWETGRQKWWLKANGKSIVARVQSTAAWWKIKPCDHLRSRARQEMIAQLLNVKQNLIFFFFSQIPSFSHLFV